MSLSSLKYLGAMTLLATAVSAQASCPAVAGPEAGSSFPHLFEKAELEATHNCSMKFSENPAIQSLNKRIAGNPALPSLSQRLPSEPLVIAPYQTIGQYGGVLDGISKATESGTSDLLSVRHVNLTRFSDDLTTVVPNVAKSWAWNEDFTQLTMTLRKGHKWSDGDDFTAEDIAFWYNHLLMDKNIIEKPKDRFLSAGKPMKVEALNDTTVRFSLNAPMPALASMFAQDYAQPFQPKHLLEKFHPKLNKNADKLAQSLGFDNGYAVINFYYGQSDWKDVPSPLLKDKAASDRLVKAGFTAIAPTLESHIVVEETLEGRRLVANPYFFQTDTAGNQLPYINEISEVFIGDEDIQTARLISGEIDYKTQAVNLPSAPVLLENRKTGNYQISLRPTVGMATFAFNMTAKDKEKSALFNKHDFRKAMSVAIDRDRINEVAYFKLGKPTQYTAFDGDTTPFVTKQQKQSNISFDAGKAKKLLAQAGLKDSDGNGTLELPSGKELKLTIHYTTQGIPTEVAEIVSANWTDVGVKTTIKEVTSDEYRNAQSANELEVHNWTAGRPLSNIATNTETLLPPYDSFFGLRTGLLWAQYRDSNGAEGVKPPATVEMMEKLASEFVQLQPGSSESNKVGQKIAQRMVDDLFMIGTVKAVAPVYRSNKLANFETPKTNSYEYYRAYPYMPTQWFLKEDGKLASN
ncbi:peptide ABC transporter substrate-binding protein [Endozoicomonas sp. OPT23]|nr:peptide ABC transporter substrate-binding protein [Endozoicomonas sp. OPT23]